MKRVVTVGLAVTAVFLAGSVAVSLAGFRNLLDPLLNQRTFVATGDVVLKRLQEKEELVAATGNFEVPVVICNGSPKSYDLEGEEDEEGRTPAEQLLDACDGILDAKATVLAHAEVDAIIDLGKLTKDDITISGDSVAVRLPPIELREARVDAERGLSVIAREGSVPIVGGELPDDYQSLAAGEAKDAIDGLASRSGLVETATRSAQSLFESLLSVYDVGVVEVTVETAPPT